MELDLRNLVRATVICDIDGCIFVHHGKGPTIQWTTEPEAIESTAKWLEQAEMSGHHIVLMTARPEHYRKWLEDYLHLTGIVYHQLVMGVSNGPRVLINDAKPTAVKTAFAYTVPRNEGVSACPKY
jgi:hydroxymethylpyrimidine pyrophosphatase-like HAD family hydrolase